VDIVKGEEFNRKSFFELLTGTFSFPFKGNGRILLIIGTIFFGIVNFFLRYNIIPFIGTIAGSFVGGYLCAYLMKIINHSADGEEELPDFPDFIDWWDSVLTPFILIFSTIIFCFIPAGAYYFLVKPIHLFADPVFLLLIGGGLFYMPMGLMAVSMSETLMSLNPLLILPSIIKVIDRYIIAWFILIGILIAEVILDRYVALPIPLIGDLVRSFLSLYFLTVEARILGLIYFQNRERLSWFGEE
jgi:hypothetical protein